MTIYRRTFSNAFQKHSKKHQGTQEPTQKRTGRKECKERRKEGRTEGMQGKKEAQTSTEREREEPWGEGRQEKAGSTAPGCRGWRSGEVGEDSTFGIPYIWLNWPTVTYSFTVSQTHTEERQKWRQALARRNAGWKHEEWEQETQYHTLDIKAALIHGANTGRGTFYWSTRWFSSLCWWSTGGKMSLTQPGRSSFTQLLKCLTSCN